MNADGGGGRRSPQKPGADNMPGLEEVQHINETALHRNVGLAVETRPDEITPDELAWFRRLGVTKVQMGVQSLDDSILELNQRGHTVAERDRRLRCCGRVVSRSCCTGCPTCWAPRRTPTGRISRACGRGFARMRSRSTRPSCLKKPPCMNSGERGEYRPYTTDELIALIADVKPSIPRYCRVNRIIRDIPSTHVVAGQQAHQPAAGCAGRDGAPRHPLRVHPLPRSARQEGECCRPEPRRSDLPSRWGGGTLPVIRHRRGSDWQVSCGFPFRGRLPPLTGLRDLEGAAIIREVHVYGQSLAVGTEAGRRHPA